ncbi:MAG: hypothetical protein AB7I42_23990 [Bradyrhizobium sp.]|uniref:hypothetical protein n=1 Tax=Bradyrhizobium sp. TaxID=376 RepID=UPI003D10AF13
MAKTSPTARSLSKLRKEGWVAGVVEKWIPQTKQRKDLFGFIDIVAVRGDVVMGVQATGGSGNGVKRLAKAVAQPEFSAWIRAGLFVVHEWNKQGAAGTRKLWKCRELTHEEIESEG